MGSEINEIEGVSPFLKCVLNSGNFKIRSTNENFWSYL